MYLLLIQFCLFIQLFHPTDDLQLVQFDFFFLVPILFDSAENKNNVNKKEVQHWDARSTMGSAGPEAHRENVSTA